MCPHGLDVLAGAAEVSPIIHTQICDAAPHTELSAKIIRRSEENFRRQEEYFVHS